MREIQLSDEQVERAAKAYSNVFDNIIEHSATPFTRRQALRAAAPFLQSPIAEPSEEEKNRAEKYLRCWSNASSDALANDILVQFVLRRNDSLTAKPDPRRETVVEILRPSLLSTNGIEKLADAILAALDRQQEGK